MDSINQKHFRDTDVNIITALVLTGCCYESKGSGVIRRGKCERCPTTVFALNFTLLSAARRGLKRRTSFCQFRKEKRCRGISCPIAG